MLKFVKIFSLVIVIVSVVCMLVAPVVINSVQNLYKSSHRERIKLIPHEKYSDVTTETYVPESWKYLKYVYVVALAIGVFFQVCSPRLAIIFGVVFIICEIITWYNKKRQ